MDREPIGLPHYPACAITRIVCTDADEMAEQLSDWAVELTHLGPGPFTGSFKIVPMGWVLICRGRYNKAMAEHAVTPEGCLTVGCPGRGSAPTSHLGHQLEDGQAFVGGPGAEMETVGFGVLCHNTVAIRCELLEQEADWLTHSPLLASERSLQLHSPGENWTSSFLDAVEWIANAVERYPDAMARADVRGSMLDTLLLRVDALAAADAPIHQDRRMRAHRRLAVERARDYIERNLTEPIRLSSLSRHAHTQARSLEYGFQEVLGVSPMAYVRTTRLHRARRLLRTTAVRTRSISEMALDCGFWHLSQFAVDYKALFGESPSVTFRRTEAQLPCSERRRQVTMLRPATGAGRRAGRSAAVAVPALS
jgi:AraC family ethanolamine operon transcriptional activator